MVIYIVLKSSFIALLVLCEGVLDNRKFSRVKRIINGKPVLELNSEYRSVKFFVVMMVAHAERTKCGGTLLTSTVMQTACHCIVDFVAEKRGYMDAILENIWENFVKMYPGAVRFERFKSIEGVTATKYIKHPNCKKGESHRTYHDYGLVILSKSMRGAKDSFAPVYTISTLADLFISTQAKASVCLIMGTGRFRLLMNKSPDPVHPNELLHGWVRVLSYQQCYRITYRPEPGLDNPKWNYTEDATWVCAKNITKFGQSHSFGDSGTPIVCNNQYVGVAGAIHHQAMTYDFRYSDFASTAFSIFENSAEYRAAFIQVVHDSDFTSIANRLLDLFNYRPTMPRIHQYDTIARNNKDHSFPNFVLMITFAVHLILYFPPVVFLS